MLVYNISLSTHNRGGEITYRHVGGNTYEFTITTCTKSSAPADRPELYIKWDDGTTEDTVLRNQVILISGFDAQKNVYITSHTFAGAGTFRVTVEDPNRNGGIINIGGTGSDQQPFCIASEIVISPFLGSNNSVVFSDCPCPEYACGNTKYCYNPQAFDPDGDSLSYKLVACLGVGCTSMAVPLVYQYPDNYGGIISIDPTSGTLCWDSPSLIGEYNVAILIEEWRSGIRIGSVLRDVQITVLGNCNNDPPVISEVKDTCVVAGDNLVFNVLATDINASDLVTLTGNGSPFTVASNPATFPAAQTNSPVNSTFSWQTDCSHIRSTPYEVYFTATDNATPVQLSDFKKINIKVLAPAPTGLTASPLSGVVNLVWDKSLCSNAQGYNVYRKKGTTTINGDCCNQQSPVELGYTLVTTTASINDTTYSDIASLAIGEEYCYVITATFPINVESCISNEFCTKLIKDVPVITHVTVNRTDNTLGIDSIMWSKASELDTITNYPPPYLYKVYQRDGFSGANTLIHTSPVYGQLYLSDTIYVHNNVNTVATANNYKVEMFHVSGIDTLLIGATNTASSVYLSLIPNDNQIKLNWTENVPWTNTSYEIYKGTAIGGVFTLIGTTTSQTYTDSNLINGQIYCYKVKSIGNYSDPSIVSPIENFSQEVCDSPIDLTPPCPPVLAIDDSCDLDDNFLVWTNPNNTCSDDVTRYKVYFSPIMGGSFTEITQNNNDIDTTYLDVNNITKAGCYYVTALDSIQYNNESLPSNIVCVNNCPIYFLPNVFSPNKDGRNDLFTPILPYRFIDSIDIIIYNRWGQQIFHTNDPMISWDGIHEKAKKEVPEGVYYYTCKVYSTRLEGVDETELKGAFHLFRNKGIGN
jgi:gliding motility-associated-like protein